MYSGTFNQHYNSAKDMLNLFGEDYETVKAEVFKLLKIKYHEKSTNNCNAVGYKHGWFCTKAKSNRR